MKLQQINSLLLVLNTFYWSSIAIKEETKVPRKIQPKEKQTKIVSVCDKLKLDGLFKHKAAADQKLASSIQRVNSNNKLSDKTKAHRMQVINIFQREINDSMQSFYDSVDNLRSFFKGNYKSIRELKEASKKRLEQLKISMLQAEVEYNQIIGAEKEEQVELKKQNSANHKQNVIKKFVNDLIGDVAIAADELEGNMGDDEFKQKIHNGNKVEIETVIKVGDNENNDADDNEGIVMLVDSESNHFVLSKPKDSTTTHVDHVLLKDIILIIIVSFFFILLCNLLKLPNIFGCILTGILLGPSGYGHLKSIVQIETIGEFGVFFILFSVGIEFSPDKLKKVLRQSLIATVVILTAFILIGLFWGALYGILPQQSFFVTFSLAFSSTPMVVKLIDAQKNRKDHISLTVEHTEDYMTLLVSMLFLQDAALGLFMAVLPILAGHSGGKSHSFAKVPTNGVVHSWFHGAFGGPWETIFFTMFELIFALIGLFFLSYILSKYIAGKFFRGLSFFGCHESYVLGILTAVFSMLLVTESVGISMELGCFICGGIIGTLGDQISKQALAVVEPFKHFFATLFFASIGFHIFPSFVFSEMVIFIPITGCVIATKFFVTAFVLHQLLPKGNKSQWLVSAGLSQLSEFSFVLGSRARRYGLISREVYLTILSITTISLIIAPVIWRFVYTAVMDSGTFSIKQILKRFKLLPR